MTPGPWRVEKCPCDNHACQSAIVEPYVVRGQGVCYMDDARLIAVAPEMRDFIEKTVLALPKEWGDEARLLLAKARGEK